MTEEKAKITFGIMNRINNLKKSIHEINMILPDTKYAVEVEFKIGASRYWTMSNDLAEEFLKKELDMKNKYLKEAEEELANL